MASSALRAVYLDSSAIVKLVVQQLGSDALVEYLADARRLTSVLATVDVPRAAYLKTGAAETIAYAEALLAHFDLVDLDPELRGAAARAAPRELRSLDAIHLAGLRVDAPGSAERQSRG